MSPIAPDESFATSYRDLMAETIAHEAETTCKVMEAIPEGDWRPDPQARTARELAWHIVNSDQWFYHAIATRNFAIPEAPREFPATIDEIISLYTEGLAGALELIRQMTPAQVLDEVDFFGSRLPVYRLLDIGLFHSIHHRGQLSTYLRPMGGKVPAIYGDSADTKA
jgi:uncharacterized damage-inducible protein DinB